MLHNEFGTSNEDDVIKQILEKGELQESEVRIAPCCLVLQCCNCNCRRMEADIDANGWLINRRPSGTVARSLDGSRRIGGRLWIWICVMCGHGRRWYSG